MIIVAGIALGAGILFFAYMQEWIIIRSPLSITHMPLHSEATRQNITLYCWARDQWHHETVSLIWPTNKQEAATYLVRAWLSYIDDEHGLAQHTSLQSVILSSSMTHALISFDRNPCDKTGSIMHKLMLIESLLKTLKESGLKLQEVSLLVHHKPLHDAHLDFSNPWPIDGFIQH